MFASFLLWALIQVQDIPRIPSALPFDEVFESLETVTLDASHEEALLSDVRKVLEFGDKLLVLDLGSNPKVLIFERTGAFVGPLGQFGSGPGEYASATDMGLDEQHIYVIDGLSGFFAAFNHDYEVVFQQSFFKWTNGKLRNASQFLSMNPRGHIFAGIVTTNGNDHYLARISKSGTVLSFAKRSPLAQKYGFSGGGGLVYQDALYVMKPFEPVLYR